MEHLFSSLFEFFRERKKFLYALLAVFILVFYYALLNIRIEEDISKFFPKDKRVEKITEVFENSSFMERMVFMISLQDTLLANPDLLINQTDSLVNEIQQELRPYIREVRYKIDDEINFALLDTVLNNLPIFLEEKDYQYIDSIANISVAKKTLQQNYYLLASPVGMMTKKVLAKDPLGISFIVLKKLRGLQFDDNFELYENCLLTKDHRYLLFFVSPVFSPNETGNNTAFINALDEIVTRYKQRGLIEPAYFGAAAVAVANARQLRNDSILTGGSVIVLLFVLFIWFFKKKRVIFLTLIPVAFGALFSITCIYLIQGYVSVLAIAAGSIVLGIAVNYSLHFFVHLKYEQNVSLVIRDITRPMTIGSLTTVMAFFFLQFTNASVLRDVGLFAGFSLIGAAFCTLVFLPHFTTDHMLPQHNQRASWIEKISLFRPEYNGYIVGAIFLLTPFFFYYASNVKFNSDMNSLNYMPVEMQKSEALLNKINKASSRALFIVSHGKNEQQALQTAEHAKKVLEKLKTDKLVTKYSSLSDFLISDSLQKQRIDHWQRYWQDKSRNGFIDALTLEGNKLGFNDRIFKNFERSISNEYSTLSSSGKSFFKENLFKDFLIEKNDSVDVVTLATIDSRNRDKVLSAFDKFHHVQAIDKQMMVTLFVDFVHEDFNFIVAVTSLLVFFVLLISLGRLELTLIAFLPMLVTWIWILGLMALFNIEFNIINVMISTFIFGLGDDYSIFTMDGLQQEYKLGVGGLKSVKVSILLSVFTTIAGLGVLIFAQHPALKSIAAISIIGIISVFIMSQTLEPFLFAWLITDRTKRKWEPATIWGWFKTIIAFSFFAMGSLMLTVVGFVLVKVIPVFKKSMRGIFHRLIRWNTGAVMDMMMNVKKKIQNKEYIDFKKPGIIISNHASFLDILLTTMLHPKIILLTNKWVWNSPVFGGVVKLADYYPVTENIETSIDKLKRVTDLGYSIVIFPEGSRSSDGRLKRFHKGAFYLSEKLKLPIRPLLIHGTKDAIRKGDFYLNDCFVTMKFLKPIEWDDKKFGDHYAERTKSISKYFKEEYTKLEQLNCTVDYYAYHLIKNYVYKGIVLEWYLRVKLKLERNYAQFADLIPHKANVLDLGCGYGFLCYMMHFLSSERKIVGVDYDEEKINTALHCYAKTEVINFVCADICKFTWSDTFQVIVLSDVLHYLKADDRRALLERCIHALPKGGKLIIRDGDRDQRERHRGTRLTEFFSTKLFRFNKAEQKLDFISGNEIREIANMHGLNVQEIDSTKFTSNIIFVLLKG